MAPTKSARLFPLRWAMKPRVYASAISSNDVALSMFRFLFTPSATAYNRRPVLLAAAGCNGSGVYVGNRRI